MLSVLRIVAGLLFFAHGTQKLLGFPASEFSPEFMSLPWIAGALELVGGPLLILGLFTRPVAFVLSGQTPDLPFESGAADHQRASRSRLGTVALAALRVLFTLHPQYGSVQRP